MTVPPLLREGLKVVAFVLLGAFGASLYQKSVPPPEGSIEDKLFEAEHKLKLSERRIAALEDSNPDGTRKGHEDTLSMMRKLVRDYKAGKKISMDDLWKLSREQMSAFIPLMHIMGKHNELRRIDSRIGELSRKYDLTPQQQDSLRAFLKNASKEQQDKVEAAFNDPSMTLPDMIRATRNLRSDDGLDKFMESTLQGEKLASYKTERLTEKANQVQNGADLKVERLNGIVKLTEEQKDKVWGIAARGSRHYDETMQLSVGSETGRIQPGDSSYSAVMAVLDDDQRRTMEVRKQEHRAKAEREADEMGLILPANWDMIYREEFGWDE